MRAGLLIVLCGLLALGACGRRGSPEQPPIKGPSAPVDPVNSHSRQVPDRPFVLDRIL